MEEGTFNASFLYKNNEETGDEGETVEIQGDFPDWVNGTVFTIGPGKFHFQETGFTVNHIADGYGIICKLAISGKKITLWKKYIQSDALRKANEAGRPVLAEGFTPSSTDVTKSTLGRIMSFVPEITDNSNHGICFFGNKIYALSGMAFLREISPKDLSSGIKYDSNKFGISSSTPHPLIDYDGTMYNTGPSISATGSKQKIFKIQRVKPGENFKDSLKKLEVIATLPSNRITHSHIHHSFGMSENYLVLVEQPYFLNAKKLLGWVLRGGDAKLNDFSEWDPEEMNRFVIVQKSTGKILKRKIQSSETFLVTHTINCYEENNQLILDVLAYPDKSHVDSFLLKSLIDGGCCKPKTSGTIKRFILPLTENFEGRFGSEVTVRPDNTMIVKAGCMSKPGLQYAVTINPNYRFRKYRFAYGISGFSLDGPYASKITKIDLTTGEEIAWTLGVDCMFGEIIFIPHPDGIDEDDGILLSAVSSGFCNGGQRFLVFICAKTMVEIGRADFKNPLALYMHAVYVPSII
ncbi:unnamed protein product [Allacma fusca]|uniref:Uncharacterized protein n=1 Tax=Allacma fusca TaxID=39272 RepID=A0A8J2PTJ5_9HEXA|nr:unnamed protein product [Allacma fusca]